MITVPTPHPVEPTSPPPHLVAALGERYELHTLIGAGAEAVVWFAHDRRDRAPVALKHFIPRPERRALHELAALLPLRHPGIVPLRDFAYLPEGDMVIVSDFIAGGSLRPNPEEPSPLPLNVVLDLARDVLAALAYLHGRDVLHRDIKPDNILRSSPAPDVARPAYLLTDFGLAGHILTRFDGPVGSPGYMAPECYSGPALIASDLYSLGVTLHELLSGQRPFDGDARALARAHLFAPPPRLLEIPPRIAAFVQQLLEKSPAHRPASARAALALLAAATLDAPPLTRTAPPPRPAAPPLAFGPASRLVARSAFSLPVATPRFALLTLGDRPVLALDEGSHLTLHDAATGAALRIVLPHSGPPAQLDTPTAIHHALGRRILRWDTATRQESCLIELSRPCARFAVHPSAPLIATTDGLHVAIDRTGPVPARLLSHQTTEIGVRTQLVWLREPALLAVTSGVLRPELALFTPEGRPVLTQPLPGPVLESPRNHGVPVWIVLDHQNSTRLLAVFLQPDLTLLIHPLPAGLRATAHAADGILALGLDARLLHQDAQGRTLDLAALPALVQTLAVSPDSRHLLLARPSASGSEFLLYAHQHA